jgi:hypothetical protein
MRKELIARNEASIKGLHSFCGIRPAAAMQQKLAATALLGSHPLPAVRSSIAEKEGLVQKVEVMTGPAVRLIPAISLSNRVGHTVIGASPD